MTNQHNIEREITVATTQHISDVKYLLILLNGTVSIYRFKYLLGENPYKEKSQNNTEAKYVSIFQNK